jgi:hypothetical protein
LAIVIVFRPISNFEFRCGRDLFESRRFNWRRHFDDVNFVVIAFAESPT